MSQATLDTSTSTRDNAQANLQQAQANTRIAEVNYGYTKVTAPFDGVVSAHLVSVGELVGVASPTQLATIVALDPIYVNFNVNEQDVLRIRAEARRKRTDGGRPQASAGRGRAADRGRAIRIRASSITPRRRSINRPERWRCAASCPMPTACCCPAISSASACRSTRSRMRLLVPDTALGSDQSGRYVLVVTSRQRGRAAQGADRPDGQRAARDRRRLKADDRVVIAGAAAGDSRREGRSATAEDRAAAASGQIGPEHDLQILHRAAGPRQRHRHPDGADRRRRAVRAAGRAISRRGAADRAGHHALSRRQRRRP